jgi:hypothetical protein
MPTRHRLSLSVLETAAPHTLTLVDTSVYSESVAVSCERLALYLPGFEEPVFVQEGLKAGFVLTLDAVKLGLQASAETPLRQLPDGVYRIEYSVSPNEQVHVAYRHLRRTLALHAYYQALARIRFEDCAPTSAQRARLEELRHIRLWLDGAKAQVEYAQATGEGLALLSYAERQLQKISTASCPGC